MKRALTADGFLRAKQDVGGNAEVQSPDGIQEAVKLYAIPAKTQYMKAQQKLNK